MFNPLGTVNGTRGKAKDWLQAAIPDQLLHRTGGLHSLATFMMGIILTTAAVVSRAPAVP